MTALYRYYDRLGALLYVGIAEDPWQRLKTHSRNAMWFGRAHRLRVEWYPDRRSARAAERAAIRGEWPLYNIHGSPWRTGQQAADVEWRRRQDQGMRSWPKLHGAAAESRRRKVERDIRERVRLEYHLWREREESYIQGC